MTQCIIELELDWLNVEEPEEDPKKPELLVYRASFAGPAIEGRAVQPYIDGVWHIEATFGDFPNKPPTVVFRTKIFHPLVDLDSGKMCAEALPDIWPSFRPSQEALAALSEEQKKCEPLLSVYRMVHSTLQSVHAGGFDSVTAVNSEAHSLLGRGGEEFDRKAAYKAGVLLFFNTIIAETLMAFLRRFKSIDALFEKLGISGGKKVKSGAEQAAQVKEKSEPKQV